MGLVQRFGDAFDARGRVSVTQIRVALKPGRAGSVRTSGDGPSAIHFDWAWMPGPSSTVMRRRTGLIFILRAHHHKSHAAAYTRIAPAVPIAQLHHHIAGLHHMLTVIKDQHTLAFEHDAVIDGF